MNFMDTSGKIEYWMEVDYMTERIQSSLAYLTPSEIKAAQVTSCALASSLIHLLMLSRKTTAVKSTVTYMVIY